MTQYLCIVCQAFDNKYGTGSGSVLFLLYPLITEASLSFKLLKIIDLDSFSDNCT